MCMSVCVCACVRARAVGDFGDLHHLIQEHPSSETTMWANKHKPQIPLAVIGTQLVLGPRNGTRGRGPLRNFYFAYPNQWASAKKQNTKCFMGLTGPCVCNGCLSLQKVTLSLTVLSHSGGSFWVSLPPSCSLPGPEIA